MLAEEDPSCYNAASGSSITSIQLVVKHISTKVKTFEAVAEEQPKLGEESSLHNENVEPKMNRKLTAAGSYSFATKRVVISFHSPFLKHEPIAQKLSYHYKDQPRSIIRDYSKEEKAVKVGRSTVVDISVMDVSPHVFYNSFKVRFRHTYADVVGYIFQSEFQFDVPFLNEATEFTFFPLGHFRPSKLVVELFVGGSTPNPGLEFYLDEISSYCQLPLDQRPYRTTLAMLKMAQSIEDLYSQRELSKMTMTDVKIDTAEETSAVAVYGRDGRREMLYSFEMPNTTHACQLNTMDFKEISMKIALKMSGRRRSRETFIGGKVHSIAGNRVFFLASYDFKSNPCTKNTISFEFNRITTRASMNALNSISLSLMPFLSDFAQLPVGWKDEEAKYGDVSSRLADSDFVWCNSQLADNKEQQTAIKNIVNCTAYPFPYVIFGPPGTGKTSSLVECVAQISKLKPDNKVLITAQSNSACDEIGSRLLKAVPLSKILRIYSAGMDKEKIKHLDPILVSSSNLRNGKNVWPTKEEFEWFSIVIVSLMSSSRFVQSDIRQGYFDYIFLDECGAASEPESLLPILGLAARNDFNNHERGINEHVAGPEITSNIVILGDHKQLGAVIHSSFAETMGLGISLMERMMTKERYKANPEYDTSYVTQLLDNYRCHPAILQFSNAQFYDNMLRSKVDESLRTFAERWELLPNPDFPVLFHCLTEASKIDPQGTSSFNEAEIEQVKYYVDYLLNRGINGKKVNKSDIGIVSPYLAQLKKLRNVLSNEVEIGTVEYYQGREKKVVIISTVKSGSGVGFLKSEKRLNVMLTRAQSLMIVVGNAATLQKDQLWRSFILYCHTNQAFTGDSF